MARTPLALNETFRPWYLAGVTHFLQDPSCITEDMIEEIDDTGVEGVESSTPASVASASFSKAAVPADIPKLFPSSDVDINPPSFIKESAMQETAKKASDKAVSEAPRLPHTPPAVDTWPSNWQKLYNALPDQASVVWTYWSFGVDIAGQPSLKRRAFIQDTLKTLALPKGTFAFWPVALADPQQESIPGLAAPHLQARADIFLYGLQKMQPRYVLMFGSKAIEGFYPDHGLRHYQQRPFENMQLIMLPPLDMLAECNGSGAAAASCAYIQTALAQLYYK